MSTPQKADQDVPRCRQFWAYTGQGEAPEHVALECNVHGIISGVTAADSDDRVIDGWADHIVFPPEQPCCPGAGTMAHVRGCVNHPEADRD